MKTKEEIKDLADIYIVERLFASGHDYNEDTKGGYIKGYTQCQEDLKPLIHDLWQLWKDLAEAGDLQIGMHFNKRFDELEKQINYGKNNN